MRPADCVAVSGTGSGAVGCGGGGGSYISTTPPAALIASNSKATHGASAASLDGSMGSEHKGTMRTKRANSADEEQTWGDYEHAVAAELKRVSYLLFCLIFCHVDFACILSLLLYLFIFQI
jgi:hypothetical protein